MRELVTHTDLDGLGCVYILSRAGVVFDRVWLCERPDQFNAMNLSTVDILDDGAITAKSNDSLFITDLDIRISGAMIFDHHGDRDGRECATLLLANYYRSSINDDDFEFAKSVDAYDRWLENSPYWEHGVRLQLTFLNDCFITGRPSHGMRMIGVRERTILSSITVEDEDGIKLQTAKIERSIREADELLKSNVDRSGNRFIYWKSTGETSFTANELLKRYPVRYAMVFYSTGRVSVRSRGSSFNCLSLPGLEGHSSAAGGDATKELLDFLNI